MRELSRIYKSETIEEGKEIYNKLKEIYKNNKLLNLIIDKYIEDIFGMFKYGRQARIITSNTDSYNKMRNRIRWKIKSHKLFENKIELKESAYLSLSETCHSYENDTRDELLEKYELEDTLNQYYVDFAYFAPRYGECYHKWDCYYLDNSYEIYCDCIYDLENRGYRPCSYCY